MTSDTARKLILLCVVAALPAPAQAAEPLGRLFFTPEQRSKLDDARSRKTRVTLTTEKPEDAVVPPVPQPEVVTFDGIVRRSDGKTTVWLNNRAVTEKDTAGSIVGRVLPDGRITVQGLQSGRSADLKVGQRAELLSGTVEEGYARAPAPPQPETKPETKPEAKPEAKAAEKTAAAASADKAKEERDRQRDMDDALRAIREAAAKLKPAAPAEPQPSSQPPR